MFYFTPGNLRAARYLPADVRRSGAAQRQSIYLADFSSFPLRGRKSCSFLRELYQRDRTLRSLATLARVTLNRKLDYSIWWGDRAECI
jgi:hypothetical protein